MNAKNIKMIVTDLDGTLLRDDKTISERSLAALKKCRETGIKVAYATGRGISAETIAPSEFFDGYVRMNGATANLSGCKTLIFSRLLPIDKVRDLLIAADNAGVRIAAEVSGMNYSNFNVTEQWSNVGQYELADFNTLDVEIEKVFAIVDSPQVVELFKSKTPDDLNLHISRDNLAMLMHEEARKSNAVAALAALWNINPSEIIAFGDDTNDIDLLKYAGTAVAMGNALDEVKAAADYICDDNMNDGIAKWLEENILLPECKKLYISDLDGTLLNQSAEISEYTKNALNNLIESGVNFSIATARSTASTCKIMEQVKLNIPIILMNGVSVYDFKQKRYIKTHFIGDATAKIIAKLKELGVTGLMYELRDEKIVVHYESLEQKPIRDFVEERIKKYSQTFRKANSFSDVPTEHIIYFTLIDTHDNVMPVHSALSEIPGLNSVVYRDNYSDDLWFLEIFNEKASKQTAIDFLSKEYGFEHITCFGDNLNDLPMFKASDYKIAVGNAKDEVKAAADYICGTNVDDGVVKWLEGFCRGGY